AALGALAALGLAGLSEGAGREALPMLLLGLSCAGLGAAAALLLRRPERIGALGLALCAATLALCPVFFDAGILRPLAMLLPPWWYLHAIHDSAFLPGLAAWAAASWALAAVLYLLGLRRES
ncbi:MAG: hypothetical protein IJ617_07455, partial [Oscillospiraceae bacterium]|nr:hypothetical protein [Oscillospiraceae bacterium]